MSLKVVSKPAPYKYEICKIIKDAIIEDRISENQVLNEQEYADKLNVSRTPIREAFNLLYENGWIRKSGRNYIVSPIIEKDIEEIFTIRVHNEKLALRLSFPKLDDIDFVSLDGILANMKKYSSRVMESVNGSEKDKLSYLNFDKKFHLSFSLLSGNERLYKMLLNLMEHFMRFGLISLREKDRIEKSYYGHQKLLESIKKHDLEKAAYVLEKNINLGKVALKRQCLLN